MRTGSVILAVVLAVAAAASAVAQTTQNASTAPATNTGPVIDLEKYRQQMMEQMRLDMGATEEEWKVLLPKIERVQGLHAAGVLLRLLNGEMLSELRSMVGSKEATDAQLREKMEGWRSALQRNREDLLRAQNDLRELITIRQEALLISRGILD